MRVWLNWIWHVEGAFGYDFWRCSGFMLAGMALLKLRVLDATRSAGFYTVVRRVGETLVRASPGSSHVDCPPCRS